MTKPSETPLVSAAHRYQSAWAEINTRIQSRQFIQGTYMTGAVVILILGLTPKDGRPVDSAHWNTAVVLLLGAFTLAVALWVRHNDSIVGYVSAYCQYFERYDDPEQTGLIPGWHDTRYKMIDSALKCRWYSDLAFAVVAATATAPALIRVMDGVCGAASLSIDWAAAVALLLDLVAIAIVLRNGPVRAKIKNEWVFGCDGSGKHRWNWADQVKGIVQATAGRKETTPQPPEK